jgi:hypothetical protein
MCLFDVVSHQLGTKPALSVSRLLLNRELYRVGQWPIIIPTAYREDYLGAIRRLGRCKSPEAFVRLLARAQEMTQLIGFQQGIAQSKEDYEAIGAFSEERAISAGAIHALLEKRNRNRCEVR